MIEDNEKLRVEHRKINLREFVFAIIQELPERSKNIIVKRFNLNQKGAQTLDKIGKEYGITRERIRQIESEAMKNLKIIGKKHNIDLLFDDMKKAIENCGGLMSEEEIVKYLSEDKIYNNSNKQISLLFLALDDKIKIAKETKKHKKIYFYKQENFAKFEDIIDILEKYLMENKKNLSIEKILSLLKEKNFSNLSWNSIKFYLDANKIILQSVIGEWGSQKWSHINPKSIRDKAYLTLKKNKKYLHFKEIAQGINSIWKSEKKANNQTVHNELIKDKRFILIGRGIYALGEWGYSPGTVLDVLLEIFKQNKKEMNQNEIVEKVLEKRKVKKNTIIFNLQNKKYFEKIKGKVYKLK